MGDLHKVDYEIDFQNLSPYPIVWSRFYNGRVRAWSFNYDRHLTLTRSADSTLAAKVVMKRQDGQQMPFTGQRPDEQSDWVWTYSTGDTSKDSLILATLTSNANLTQFQFKTNTDETEIYDSSGKLLSLKDIRNLPLTFVYDEHGRLTGIQDSSQRSLIINYPAFSDSDASTLLPSSIDNDHTTTVQYSYQTPINGTYPLATVAYSTGNAERTGYLYDSLGRLSGISDGNYVNGGAYNQWATYGYDDTNPDKVTQTYHGDHHQTLIYSDSGITTPTGGLVQMQKQPDGMHKITHQLQICGQCSGAQNSETQYDSQGNPTYVVGLNGEQTTNTYTSGGDLQKTIEADHTDQGRSIEYDWDVRFHKPTMVFRRVQTPNAEGSRMDIFTYDDQGNMTAWDSYVYGDDGYSAYRGGTATYNRFGEPLTVTDARGKVTRYTYDEANGNLVYAINPLGQAITYGSHDPDGRPTSMTDPNGLTTHIDYDGRGRIQQISRGCDPSQGADCHWETTILSYDGAGQIFWAILPNGTAYHYYHDTAHRLVQKDRLGSQNQVLGSELYNLDEDGNVINVTETTPNGLTIQTHAYQYSASDLLSGEQDSSYNTTSLGRDPEGRLTSSYDPLGRSVQYTYDLLGRLVDMQDADHGHAQMTYGADDTLLIHTDTLGHQSSYTYDGFGAMVSRYSPDSGWLTMTRDADGNVITRNGSVPLEMTYDDTNRVLTQARPGAQQEDRTFVYDTCSNGIGHLCQAKSSYFDPRLDDQKGQEVVAFTYDHFGRMSSKSQTGELFENVPLSAGFAYDEGGQLGTIVYPSGAVVHQTWQDGRLVGISWNDQSVVGQATYDAADHLTGWIWPSGRLVQMTWDHDGRPQAISGGPLTQSFHYDNAWRLISVGHTDNGVDDDAETYGYDNQDQLTSSNLWGSYTYDANGNRLTWQGAMGARNYQISPGTNQIQAVNNASLGTDAAGRITVLPGSTFMSYTSFDQLESYFGNGQSMSFTYNALNERISKFNGSNAQTTRYFYSSVGQLMGVYDEDGNPLEEYVYMGSRVVATVRNGIIYPIETDHLMTPVRVLDPSTNATLWSWTGREPFGATSPQETGLTMGLRFPGQYQDVETGLVYNGFRDYDPELGRYLEPDPLEFRGGKNTYAYVGSGPVSKADELGLIISINASALPRGNQQEAINQTILALRDFMGYYESAGIVNDLTNSSSVYTIFLNERFDDTADKSNILSHDIQFNPFASYQIECKKTGARTYMTPAAALLHELDHSDHGSSLLRLIPLFGYDNAEEWRAVNGAEMDYRKHNGEGVIRDNHQVIGAGKRVNNSLQAW